VGRQVGSGGQGQVFEAEHVETGEVAALKLLLYHTGNNEAARQRLRDEKLALARIRHPNIVSILDQGEDEHGYYLAMEYLQGTTLHAVIRDCAAGLHPVVTANIGAAMADALAATHAAGLVHGDLKSENVMLVGERQRLRDAVRLIDFGAVTAGARNENGSVLGTLSFLAPEILQGEAPSPKSDLYALGITLYHAATASVPYRAISVEEQLRAIESGRRRPLQEMRPDWPDSLAQLVGRALHTDPAQRWATATAVMEALDAFVATAPDADEHSDLFALDGALTTGEIDPRHDMPTKVIPEV
jgi:serine/threonine-protein kinase